MKEQSTKHWGGIIDPEGNCQSEHLVIPYLDSQYQSRSFSGGLNGMNALLKEQYIAPIRQQLNKRSEFMQHIDTRRLP